MPTSAESANLRRLLVSLNQSEADVAAKITDRIRREISELKLIDDAGFWQVIHDSSVANIKAGLSALAGGQQFPRSAPLEVAEAARFAAGAGVSLASLLRAYRIAHAVVWSEWLRRTEALGLPAPQRASLLEQGSEFLFAFVDHVATLATDEYTRERDSFLRTQEQRRSQLVHDLLDGAAVDASDLGYELTMEHIGIVAAGPGAEEAIHDLAERMSRRRLTIHAAEGVLWAWLGERRPPSSVELRRLRAPELGPETRLAFGDCAPGREGFRRTHRQARDAHWVGERLGQSVTHYDEVALEALLGQDERRAREFAARELAGLDGADDRSRRLRETLRAYFASAQNAAAAASLLGVHDQTVTYRLRTIEERLGRPVIGRRAELEVALRLTKLLGE